MTPTHLPVLQQEAIDGLAIQENGLYIDATFGRGGHSRAILETLGPDGQLIALDQDPQAIEHAQHDTHFSTDQRFHIYHANFSELESVIRAHTNQAINGILFDLGTSSPQLDTSERGFSFRQDGPLDMRMNPADNIPTAADWLAQADMKDIAYVLKRYGEEPAARKIAQRICTTRDKHPLTTTQQLADLICDCIPAYQRRKHPATKTFQAIRIHINQELEVLTNTLPQATRLLAPGGRLCVISFHSLEDRITKRFIQAQACDGDPHNDLPIPPPNVTPSLTPIGRLIRPSQTDIINNPRARSARLRIAEKCL